MDKIRVVNIITDLNIGGAGKVLQNYYSHCDYDKFEHWVIVPEGSKLAPILKSKGPRVIAFEHIGTKSFSIKAIKPTLKLLKKIKPDIVHTHACLSARIAASLKKGVKVVYTRHCVYEPSWLSKSFIGKLIGKIVFALFADRVIAISPASMKNLTATGIPNNKIDVLMNGTDPLKKSSSANILSEKIKLGIGEHDFVFTMVGRLEEVKGHRYFIKAASMMKKNMQDVKFIIVGEGSKENEFKKLARGIEQDMLFVGFIKNVSKIVNISDVIVNASFGTEASSLAIIEAMSLGKPVIATEYGGNPYQVENNVTGIIVPIKSTSKLAEAMTSLKNDKDMYQQMSENSLNEYKGKFTAEIMAGNIEEIYGKLVDKDV